MTTKTRMYREKATVQTITSEGKPVDTAAGEPCRVVAKIHRTNSDITVIEVTGKASRQTASALPYALRALADALEDDDQ